MFIALVKFKWFNNHVKKNKCYNFIVNVSEILVKLAILTFAGHSSFHVPNAIHPKEDRQSFLI
ncbi:hypothetical protein EF83_08655 [Bacillus subtilis]|nr:hypothetical protein EF83_08655 [Bacillus subtilis]